jgi:hypothetical protein
MHGMMFKREDAWGSNVAESEAERPSLQVKHGNNSRDEEDISPDTELLTSSKKNPRYFKLPFTPFGESILDNKV